MTTQEDKGESATSLKIALTHVDLARGAVLRGDLDESLVEIAAAQAEASRIAEPDGRDLAQALIHLARGDIATVAEDPRRAHDAYRHAFDGLEEFDGTGLESAVACLGLAEACLALAEYADGIAWVDRADERAEGSEDAEFTALRLVVRARLRLAEGDITEAESLAARGLDLLPATAKSRPQALSHLVIALARMGRGAYLSSVAAFDAAEESFPPGGCSPHENELIRLNRDLARRLGGRADIGRPTQIVEENSARSSAKRLVLISQYLLQNLLTAAESECLALISDAGRTPSAFPERAAIAHLRLGVIGRLRTHYVTRPTRLITEARLHLQTAEEMFTRLGLDDGEDEARFQTAVVDAQEALYLEGTPGTDSQVQTLREGALRLSLISYLRADRQRLRFATEADRAQWHASKVSVRAAAAFELAEVLNEATVMMDLIAFSRASGILLTAASPVSATTRHPSASELGIEPDDVGPTTPDPDAPLIARLATTSGLGLDAIFRRAPVPNLRMPDGRVALSTTERITVRHR